MTPLPPNRRGRVQCYEVRDRLDDFLDGELSPVLMRRFGNHAASCPRCRPLVEHERALLREIRQAVRAVAAPQWLEAHVSAAVAAAHTEWTGHRGPGVGH